MPDVPLAGLRRSALHALAASIALAFAGCSEPTPADAEAEASPAANHAPVLQCLPTALLPLPLPLAEGFAATHADAATSPALAECMQSLFGSRTLKSPAAFDRAYGRVFAYHEEDGTLAPATLRHRGLRLFRLGDTGGARVWLLRIDTGTELEEAHLDVLLSTAKADGALVDQLLVGGMGLLYRRDYDVEAADAFSIREETGNARETGPGYRASYRIAPDGRFTLVSGSVLDAP
ncbi:hypothetical protein FQY83_16260 [Luteimonas marina]|uniref:Uncharacterized protein n=1 Tax=Luteimonas marina TaxID=488485 RepID=A0A5C5TWZ4_9GAMM|nr:hypothetical protein [Luteimonas marina]TWT17842.1 hypothetical protein FQY83_16260 [Luteimonas marina]